MIRPLEDPVVRVRERFRLLSPALDERLRRLWAASEARALGRGGVARVAEATGLSRSTVEAGLKDLERPEILASSRVRCQGSGRKPITLRDPSLVDDLERLVEAGGGGEEMPHLRWTLRSTARMAAELTALGHQVSARKVAHLLSERGYRLLANSRSGHAGLRISRGEERLQLSLLNREVGRLQARGQPVVSAQLRLGTRAPERGAGADPGESSGDAQDARRGAADFAGQCVLQAVKLWWQDQGRAAYPNAAEILIVLDPPGERGGLLGAEWRAGLRELARSFAARVSVSHLPPVTSKWNELGHGITCEVLRGLPGLPRASCLVEVRAVGRGAAVAAGAGGSAAVTGVAGVAEGPARGHVLLDGVWNYTVLPLAGPGV
jgi:hypothetical protein